MKKKSTRNVHDDHDDHDDDDRNGLVWLCQIGNAVTGPRVERAVDQI